mgnify:CR=1 FL=1
MFEKKWVIFLSGESYDLEEIEIIALETEVEDVTLELWYIKITTSVENFRTVRGYIESQWLEIHESKIDYIPTNEIELTEHEKILKLTKMLQAFDEDEDVNYVSSNEIIAAELQAEVDAYIKEHSFRT